MNRRFLTWVRLFFFFGAVAALQPLQARVFQAPAEAQTTQTPNAAKRQIDVRLGTVDAVTGAATLAMPLGPQMPGRIPVGFLWALNGSGQDSIRGPQTILPVEWPKNEIVSYPDFGTQYDTIPYATTSLTLRGTLHSFYRVKDTQYPSLALVQQWMAKRGVAIPTAIQWLIYANTDGSMFYIEGRNDKRSGFNSCHLYSSADLRCILNGTEAIWSDQNKTYFTNLWGDKVSMSESIDGGTQPISGSSHQYSVILKNELSSSDVIQMSLVQDTSVYSSSYAYPFHATISNSLGRANIEIDGECSFPGYFLPDQQPNPDGYPAYSCPSISTGIYYFTLGKLQKVTQHSSSGPDKVTQFSWGLSNVGQLNSYPGINSVPGLSVTYSDGVVEQFDSSLPYFITTQPNLVNTPYTPNGPYSASTFFFEYDEVFGQRWNGFKGTIKSYSMVSPTNPNRAQFLNVERSMWVKESGGVCRIRTTVPSATDPNAGRTVLIARQNPTVKLDSVGTPTFVKPDYFTTILVYPTASISSATPYRGLRLTHSKGQAWSDPAGQDAYLFYSGSVLREESIHGTGGPTTQLSSSDQTVLAAALYAWQPAGYTVDQTTLFEGWELRNWLNPQGFTTPFAYEEVGLWPNQVAWCTKPMNAVASRHITYAPTTSAPTLPVNIVAAGDTNVANSRDAWGPVLTDEYSNASTSSAALLPLAPGSAGYTTDQTAAPKWANQVSSLSSPGVHRGNRITRHWDDTLGLMIEDTRREWLDGSALPSLRRNIPSSGVVDLGTTTNAYNDSLDRLTSVTTVRGAASQQTTKTYLSGLPLVQDETVTVIAPQITSPSFSGQIGKTYAYDSTPYHWLVTETDKLTGRTIQYNTRNAMGQVTQTTDVSSGVVTTLAYDDWGRLASKKREAKGTIGALLTTYQYDNLGAWRTETVQADGRSLTTRWDYDPLGHLVKTTKPDQTYELRTYDGWGQLVSRSPWLRPTQQSYGQFSYSYDDKGRQTQLKNPKGHVVWSQPTEPGWTSVTAPSDQISVIGVAATVLDDRGNSKTEVRDLLGQRTAVIDEVGQITKFAYDQYGNLVETDNGGLKRSYAYTELGWLLSRKEPEEGTTTFGSFTALGTPRLTSRKGVSGSGALTIETTLDTKHRPSQILSKSAGTAQVTRSVVYREDFSVPSYITETQASGSLREDYGYDAIGRLNSKKVSDGVYNFTVSRVLGAAGSEVSLSYPAGGGQAIKTVATTYDSVLRPSVVTWGGGTRGTMTYDQVTATSYTDTLLLGNGASTVSKNDMGDLVQVTHNVVSGLTNNKQDNYMSWSDGGLLLTRGPDAANSTIINDSFSYDSLQRLSGAAVAGLNAGERITQGFTYDRHGNRIASTSTYSGPSAPDEAKTWSTTATDWVNNRIPSQLQTAAGPIYPLVTYDDWGQITDVMAVPGLSTSRTLWAYDPSGRMVRETTNGVLSTFLLDTQGLRFVRTQGTTVTYTVYGFNREPLMQLQKVGTGSLLWSKSMVYGFGQLLSEENAGTTGTVYVQGDQVGSPNILTNSLGAVVGRAKNLPFGERFGQTGTKSIRRYTNHEDEPGSAIYMQARAYMPYVGKFAQPDPQYDQKVYDKDSWNLYGYVSNNPITRTDPTGEVTGHNSGWLDNENSNLEVDAEMKKAEKEAEKVKAKPREEQTQTSLHKFWKKAGQFVLDLKEGLSATFDINNIIDTNAASHARSDAARAMINGSEDSGNLTHSYETTMINTQIDLTKSAAPYMNPGGEVGAALVTGSKAVDYLDQASRALTASKAARDDGATPSQVLKAGIEARKDRPGEIQQNVQKVQSDTNKVWKWFKELKDLL